MRVTLPPLHHYQQLVAKNNARFKVLACGRRWGKSKLAAVLALKHALEGKTVWWVAPTYMISNIGWNMIRPLATQVFAEVHESTRTLTFPTGGSISCKSGDKPDNLRGESLAFVIMDEADFMPERVWTEVIRPALSDQKGGALIISTPNVEGGWFHQLFNDGQDDQIKDVKSWRFPSVTNPYLDPDEIEAAKNHCQILSSDESFLLSSSRALVLCCRMRGSKQLTTFLQEMK